MGNNNKKITVGVWMPLHPGLRLRGEGLFRYLSFVAGGLPENVQFLTFIPPWLKTEFEEELLDLPLDVRKKFSVKYLKWEFSFPTIILASIIAKDKTANDPWVALQKYKKRLSHKNAKGAHRLWELSYFLKSWRFFIPTLLLVETVSIFSIILTAMREYYFVSGCVLLFSILCGFLGLRLSLKSLVKESSFEKDIAPNTNKVAIVGKLIAKRFHQSLEGLAVILCERDYNNIAKKLSKKKISDCWYIVNSSLRSARWLSGPTVSVFADFMFLSCPSNVPPRALRRLKADVNRLLNKVDQIICLSEHVRRDHLAPIAGKRTLEKVNIVRVAPVDIHEDAPYVTLANNIPVKTPTSISAAKSILKNYLVAQETKERLRNTFRLKGYMADRHLIMQYLLDLADSNAPFVFCSTQNRAYKNVALVVKAVAELRKRELPGLRLIMTGQVDYSASGLSELITELGAVYDFISLPRVPRPVHAALFHLASVTIHPSFHEGGTGAFPLWESTSVGTPAVLSRNASSLEDRDLQNMDNYMFDPYSVDEAKQVLLKAILDPEVAMKCQRKIIFEKDERGENWYSVGHSYYEIFQKTIEAHHNKAKLKN